MLGAALLACSVGPGPNASGSGLDPAAVAAGITAEGLGSTLDALAGIATDNGGTRRTGGPGNAATVAYVETQLRELGYQVHEDTFDGSAFTDGNGDTLELDGSSPTAFAARQDFGPMMFSPEGTVDAPVFDLGWDPAATAADGPGCVFGDFGSVPAGAIVLARPSNCFRRQVVLNAQTAGAAALVTAYPWLGSGQLRRPTLVDPAGLQIPAIAADAAVGNALEASARSGAHVRLVTTGTSARQTLTSVIAERPGADPSKVVMVGAHMDSSMDGPGIDDDGTGVAAVLALAAAIVHGTPPVTIRFGFWAAEESGLHGSTHYVDGRSSADRAAIVAYLNADMLGSPNGFRAIYDDAGAAPGSGAIRDLFEHDLTAAGLAWETMDLAAASDHAPFEQAGIPTGGLFSGANEVVTPDEASTFGTTAGEWADACYHLACDNRTNVNMTLFVDLARSFARVSLEVAGTPRD